MSVTLQSIVLSVMLSTGVAPDEFQLKEAVCLTQAVNWEAGNQSNRGKVGVAQVLMNRIRNPRFPDSHCGVFKQPGQFNSVATAQSRVPLKDSSKIKQLEESAKAALEVMDGRHPDVTGGALYFVNLNIATNTGWLNRLRKTVKIGDHTFFK